VAAPASSITSVVVALLGNTFVAIIKLVAFAVSGSGAMLSEGIHSIADTGNQLLLFLGLKRGARAPDDDFHYGYGGERFVFGLLSAAGIFFLGCGVTIYHGIDSLVSPHMPDLTALTFVVLAVAFVVEGGVLLFAIRALHKARGSMTFFRYVRERADPAAVAILLEDGAAVLGLLLAAAGIIASSITGDPTFDAVASILVGVVLGAVAFYLVKENRELLLGVAVPEGVEDRFTAILRGRPSVRDVRDVRTKQLTPETYKFAAEIQFDDQYLAKRLAAMVPGDGVPRDELLRAAGAAAVRVISEEIAEIERLVRVEIPQAAHIDIELVRPAG
jgi:zinc transporter 9